MKKKKKKKKKKKLILKKKKFQNIFHINILENLFQKTFYKHCKVLYKNHISENFFETHFIRSNNSILTITFAKFRSKSFISKILF